MDTQLNASGVVKLKDRLGRQAAVLSKSRDYKTLATGQVAAIVSNSYYFRLNFVIFYKCTIGLTLLCVAAR